MEELNTELVKYIENDVFPLYNRNEKGHGIEHIKTVIERLYQHLSEKYGESGYAKVYLEDEEFDKSIKELRKALSNKDEFIERVKKVISK